MRQSGFNQIDKLLQRMGPDSTTNSFSPVKNHEGRNSQNLVQGSILGVLIDIEFADFDSIGQTLGQNLQNRFHHFTRGAP